MHASIHAIIITLSPLQLKAHGLFWSQEHIRKYRSLNQCESKRRRICWFRISLGVLLHVGTKLGKSVPCTTRPKNFQKDALLVSPYSRASWTGALVRPRTYQHAVWYLDISSSLRASYTLRLITLCDLFTQ